MGLECVVSGKIQGRRETDDAKGHRLMRLPPSPDVYVLPWSEGPTRERRRSAALRWQAFNASWLKLNWC